MNVKVKKKAKEERFNVIENKGITLIALVITIIVLLILAGVALATLTGENGILTQANRAQTETTKVSVKEQVELEVLGSYGADGNIDNDLLKTNLNNIKEIQGVPNTIDNTSFPLTVTVDGVKIDIKKDGTVSYAFDATEWDKTATPEDCFIWESDVPGEEGYDIIIGYTDKLELYTKLVIPSRCTKIDLGENTGSKYNSSRSFCSSIKTIELPDTIVEIGNWAFAGDGEYGFGDLESVTIPESVTCIGNNAFHICRKLNSITIPSSVTTIGEYVFLDCISLQTINVQGYTSIPSGWNSNWNAGCSATINWGQ